jgi:multidrug efflux system membrane fusion protein
MKLSTRAAVLATLFCCLAGCSGSHQSNAPVDPIPVVVTTATLKAVTLEVDAVGTVEPVNSVQIKSRVDGQLLRASVTDGQDVKAGDLLFNIDPRPIQAQIEQSLAAITRDQAQIDQARTEMKRFEPMAEKGFVSNDQLDMVRTNERIAIGALKVEQANLEGLKLQLSFTEIRAPISGRVGRILVQPGNLIKANDTTSLLVLNQLAPIYVSFALPQRFLGDIHTASTSGKLITTARMDGVDLQEHGELAFVDNAVDTTTGTVKLRALFANDDSALWPGQFVNVTLGLGSKDDAIVVPDVAVQTGPDGNYVFVVRNEQEVEQRTVSVDRSQNGESVIAHGLSGGETVVVDGQSRLVNGSLVTMTRALQ